MKDWLIENWRFVLEVGLLLISLIVCLIRKDKKFNIGGEGLYDLFLKIPEYINDAESKFTNGSDKLDYVMVRISLYLLAFYGNDVYSNIGTLDTLKDYVENILSTPTKKEVKK